MQAQSKVAKNTSLLFFLLTKVNEGITQNTRYLVFFILMSILTKQTYQLDIIATILNCPRDLPFENLNDLIHHMFQITLKKCDKVVKLGKVKELSNILRLASKEVLKQLMESPNVCFDSLEFQTAVQEHLQCLVTQAMKPISCDPTQSRITIENYNNECKNTVDEKTCNLCFARLARTLPCFPVNVGSLSDMSNQKFVEKVITIFTTNSLFTDDQNALDDWKQLSVYLYYRYIYSPSLLNGYSISTVFTEEHCFDVSHKTVNKLVQLLVEHINKLLGVGVEIIDEKTPTPRVELDEQNFVNNNTDSMCGVVEQLQKTIDFGTWSPSVCETKTEGQKDQKEDRKQKVRKKTSKPVQPQPTDKKQFEFDCISANVSAIGYLLTEMGYDEFKHLSPRGVFNKLLCDLTVDLEDETLRQLITSIVECPTHCRGCKGFRNFVFGKMDNPKRLNPVIKQILLAAWNACGFQEDMKMRTTDSCFIPISATSEVERIEQILAASEFNFVSLNQLVRVKEVL